MLRVTPAYKKINIRIRYCPLEWQDENGKEWENAENRRQNKIIQRKRLNNMNGNQWKGIKEWQDVPVSKKKKNRNKLMLNHVIIRKYMNEIYIGSTSRECKNETNERDDNNGKYKKVTLWNGIERGFRILTTQWLSTIVNTPPPPIKKKKQPKERKTWCNGAEVNQEDIRKKLKNILKLKDKLFKIKQNNPTYV